MSCGGVMPLSVSAAEPEVLDYSLAPHSGTSTIDETGAVIDATDDIVTVVIPSSVTMLSGKTVTVVKIADSAFDGKDYLESVVS